MFSCISFYFPGFVISFSFRLFEQYYYSLFFYYIVLINIYATICFRKWTGKNEGKPSLYLAVIERWGFLEDIC